MIRLIPCIVLALICAAVTNASAQITVTAKPATVATRAFDPDNPPREMPPLKSGEAAVCSSKFACGVQVEVQISQVEGEKPKMQITAVSATLSLDIVIWLPVEASEKIRLHEEGHRQISELFYKRGDQAARTLAGRYVGRELTISSIEPTATQPIIERIASEFCKEYLGTIEEPSEKTQERYDKLTDHGRNRVNEQEAIRQALKEGESK